MTINTREVERLWYGEGIFGKWTREELEESNCKSRQIMTLRCKRKSTTIRFNG